MEKDRIKWNKKYRARSYNKPTAEIVARFSSLARPGRALDIAAGLGNNGLFLADKGFEVDAVDISDVAMDELTGRHSRVQAICEDLDTYDIPAARYSLILNIRYLNRRLFPGIVEGLIPGGVLIFETFIEKIGEGGGATCRDYLLRENELLHAFLSMNILFYEEKKGNSPRGPFKAAALVALKN